MRFEWPEPHCKMNKRLSFMECMIFDWTFSAPVNLAGVPAPTNPDPAKQTSQLEVVHDVAVWDPSSRRG
jgi:hypothetical protein